MARFRAVQNSQTTRDVWPQLTKRDQRGQKRAGRLIRSKLKRILPSPRWIARREKERERDVMILSSWHLTSTSCVWIHPLRHTVMERRTVNTVWKYDETLIALFSFDERWRFKRRNKRYTIKSHYTIHTNTVVRVAYMTYSCSVKNVRYKKTLL